MSHPGKILTSIEIRSTIIMEINTYGRITHEVYNAKHIYTNTHSRSYREEDTNRFKKNYIANEYSNNIPECKLDILPV